MKIGLVIESFDPRRGGAELWTYQHAASLLARGHEVHVIAQDVSAEGARLPVAAHRLPPVRMPLAKAAAAEALLRTLDLDLVHDMGVGWNGDILQPHGGCWTAITRQKMLLFPPWFRPIKRTIDPWLPRFRQHESLVARQAAAEGQILLALSQKVADEFCKYHDVSPSRIRVVYNGVDVNRFSPERRGEFRLSMRRRLGVPDDAALALAVAHHFEIKGIPTLLAALERLKPKRLPLHTVVVGNKRASSWQRHADARQWPVTFVGPQIDTVPFYAAADFLVHPSFYDSCSLVLLEAAASGLPLLVSRENGGAELLTDGLEGLLLTDPADAETLADQMERMLDPSLREKMGSAARRLAMQHTLDRNCNEILEIYRQAAEARRRSAGSRRPGLCVHPSPAENPSPPLQEVTFLRATPRDKVRFGAKRLIRDVLNRLQRKEGEKDAFSTAKAKSAKTTSKT
jgi:UDP-glucose:(heptosyl)LPS alpha-1,3-glucosyltransferase